MELIPLPSEKKYLEMGQIRQKMGRILSYLIQKYSADCGKSYDDYSGAHRIIYSAWDRMNEDPEFCEQVELYLPAPEPPSVSPFASPEGTIHDATFTYTLSAPSKGHSDTYLTKEALQKGVKAYKDI